MADLMPGNGFQAWQSSLVTNSAATLAGMTAGPVLVSDLSTRLSQVDKVVRDLQKSFDQLRSEVGAATTTFKFSPTPGTQQPGNCKRLSALEAVCEDLRHGLDALQERVAFPEATEQTPTAPGVDKETVTSMYVILRTEVMQEVGQLRSFIEKEVQSLRSQFEVESVKVEKNVSTLCGLEAANGWLSQRITELSQDLAKLQARGFTCESEVGELRSRLEVVVRECDEHVSMEQSRRSQESVAIMNSVAILEKSRNARSAEEKDLENRVRSLESACQRAIAAPSAVSGQLTSVSQTVELLQRQYGVIQERISNLTDSVAHACTAKQLVANGVGTQQQQQQQQGEAIKDTPQSACGAFYSPMSGGGSTMGSVKSSSVTIPLQLASPPSSGRNGLDNSHTNPSVRSCSHPPAVQAQETRLEKAVAKLDELSDEMRAERAQQIILAEKMTKATETATSSPFVGTLMKRVCALESMITRQAVSRVNDAAKRVQSPTGAPDMAASASSTHVGCGAPAAANAVVNLHSMDRGTRQAHVLSRSLELPASEQHVAPIPAQHLRAPRPTSADAQPLQQMRSFSRPSSLDAQPLPGALCSRRLGGLSTRR